jgi:lysocardiolipin and lysophospholipid acyltransferase
MTSIVVKEEKEKANVAVQDEAKPVPWSNGVNRKASVLNTVKGVSYLVFLLLTAFYGSAFLTLPVLPVMFAHFPLFRRVGDFLQFWWFHLPVSVMQWVFNIKFVVSGDEIRRKDHASVFLSNHRTRLDWMYLWSYFFHHGRLLNEKIALKSALKKLPGFGVAMQVFAFLFLQRNRAKDLAHMHELFGAYGSNRYPVQFLLFPEGTDLCASAMASSYRFADREGLPRYKHVLHPRSGAFLAAVGELRGRGLDAVYDITMGYPDVVPQGEIGAARGNYPHEIHIDVKRFAVDELPGDDAALEAWLKERWRLKEAQLTRFYEHKATLSGDANRPERATQYDRMSTAQTVQCAVAVGGWIVFIVASLYATAVSTAACIYLAAAHITMTIVTFVFGGADHLQLRVLSRAGILKTRMKIE